MNDKHFKCIQKVLDDAVKSNSVAGGTVAILMGDNEVYRQHFGYANIEKNIKPDDNTIFRMFSMTKPVTAVATMILIERGLLDYNDNVSKYLDGFKNPTVLDWNTNKGIPADREVQIRDLLTMTSGLPYPGDWSESSKQVAELFDKNTELIRQGGGMSTVDFCNEMGKIPLLFNPSHTWLYGTSADVLGAIIEVVSGKSLRSFLKDELFNPLGMVDTDFYISEDNYHRLAEVYYHDDDKNILVPFTGMNLCITDYKKPPKFESGGAGLVSTINDYQKFIKMLMHNGEYNGVRILGRKSVELLRTPALSSKQMEGKDDKEYNYGCLVRVLQDTQIAGTNASIGEYGWDGWTGNYFCIDPVENISVMYFIQLCGAGFTDVARKIRAITFGSIE